MKYHDFLPDNNLEKKYFQEVVDNLDLDITVVAKNFGDKLPPIDGDKIILMNADESYRLPSELSDPSVKFIFKQYCNNNQWEQLKPIPLGPSKDLTINYTPINEREYDVTFVGQMASNRATILRNVTSMTCDPNLKSFFGFYQGFNRGVSSECYSQILQQTKVAICPHGACSPETFRFFEAMKNVCVVIAPKMPDNWVYEKTPHHIFEENLHEKVRNILRLDIENESQKSLEYHKSVSPKSVADYMKGIINA